MSPQSQTQQPATQFAAQAPVQPHQRVRPAAPEGARAPAAAIAQAQMAPMPKPPFAEGAAAQVTAQPIVAHAPRVQAQSLAAVGPSQVAAVYPRAQERRRSPRQTLVAKAIVRSEFNQNTVATGFLSSISMLGVGFHTRRPLAVGEKFQMRLELGPMKWATRLRVVACQPHESGTYDIGAEFIGSDLVDRVQRELAA